MNDLYIYQLETENKQLRLALQECRKALEEEIEAKKKAIEYIKDTPIDTILEVHCGEEEEYTESLLEILGDKENECKRNV
jgi:hypothetical protein